MNLIYIDGLRKHFKILNRREGLSGMFRFAFTYIIPIGFVAFYPSQLFLRPEEVSPLIYFSPIVGIGLFAITYWIWTKGVNSYTGTGS
jgi:viologen exporter family transport system permease protein